MKIIARADQTSRLLQATRTPMEVSHIISIRAFKPHINGHVISNIYIYI